MFLFGFGFGFGQQSSRYSKNYWCQSVCLLLVILIHTVSRECSGGEVPSVNVIKEPHQVSSRDSPVVPGRITAGRSGGQDVKSSEVKAPTTDYGDFNSKPSRGGGSRAERGRAMSSVFSLDPMGMIKSASRVLTKGVHTFRESLHEGVKVAQMLKDDVDEGVTQIWGQKKSSSSNTANNKEKEKETEIETNTEDKMHRPTGDAASEPHSFPQDTGFSNSNSKQTFREGMLGGIGGILRFMNVDSSRLGIIALNLLIYVAEMITTSLLGKDNSISETRAIKANILQYFITGHSNMLDNLMKDAKSEALPESLIETLRTKTGNDTSCVQLLICKMSPLIWSVQKTLEKNPQKTAKSSSQQSTDSKKGKTSRERPRSSSGSGTGSDSGPSSVIDDLYSALPSKGGFISNGDKCEKRFPNCRLLKFKKH